LGDPARPVWEDAFVFSPVSATPDHDALQNQSQSLLLDPANWQNATRSNTTDNFGNGYVLPYAFFHDDSRTGPSIDQSGLFQTPTFGSAEQPFSFTQTNPFKGQTDNFGYQSLFGTSAQPYPSLTSEIFGRQPANPLTTPPFAPGISDFDLTSPANLKFPNIDFSTGSSNSDWPKLTPIADSNSVGLAFKTPDQNTLSFAIEGTGKGKDTLAGPFQYKVSEENKLLGTNFSLSTSPSYLLTVRL
jgi:hypothetical protein